MYPITIPITYVLRLVVNVFIFYSATRIKLFRSIKFYFYAHYKRERGLTNTETLPIYGYYGYGYHLWVALCIFIIEKNRIGIE